LLHSIVATFMFLFVHVSPINNAVVETIPFNPHPNTSHFRRHRSTYIVTHHSNECFASPRL